MSHRLRTFYLLIVFFCCMSLAGHAAGATASDDNTKARAVATLDDLESYQKYVDAISRLPHDCIVWQVSWQVNWQ